jgi:hypothetical protein
LRLTALRLTALRLTALRLGVGRTMRSLPDMLRFLEFLCPAYRYCSKLRESHFSAR